MDLLERGLCESHTKVPYESMIEPEESKVDTITHYHHYHHHHHHYHRQHHHYHRQHHLNQYKKWFCSGSVIIKFEGPFALFINLIT